MTKKQLEIGSTAEDILERYSKYLNLSQSKIVNGLLNYFKRIEIALRMEHSDYSENQIRYNLRRCLVPKKEAKYQAPQFDSVYDQMKAEGKL